MKVWIYTLSATALSLQPSFSFFKQGLIYPRLVLICDVADDDLELEFLTLPPLPLPPSPSPPLTPMLVLKVCTTVSSLCSLARALIMLCKLFTNAAPSLACSAFPPRLPACFLWEDFLVTLFGKYFFYTICKRGKGGVGECSAEAQQAECVPGRELSGWEKMEPWPG